MATYITLLNWTDQGIKEFKQSTARAGAAAEHAERLGAKLLNVYWTVGQYDVVGIVEAPDDETATAFALGIGSLGAVRSTTLRAFDRETMEKIIEKAG